MGAASTTSGSTVAGSGGTGGSPFGTAQIIASGQTAPSDLTLDSHNVYWVNRGGGTGGGANNQILSLAKSSTCVGAACPTIATGEAPLIGIGVDALNAYCGQTVPGCGCSGISKFPLASKTTGLPMVTIYEVPNAGSLTALAVQGYVVAFSTDQSQNNANGSVYRGTTNASSTAPVPKPPLATNQGIVTSVALDAGDTYWVSSIQGGGGVIKYSGGTMQVFAKETAPTTVIVDTDNVYWSSGEGTVKMLAKANPNGMATVLATGEKSPTGLAVDAKYVYWTDFDSPGPVRAAPKSGGGKVQTIAKGTYPFGIAVDASNVYVTMQGDGTVVRIPVQ
jgi:hypothetical protein